MSDKTEERKRGIESQITRGLRSEAPSWVEAASICSGDRLRFSPRGASRETATGGLSPITDEDMLFAEQSQQVCDEEYQLVRGHRAKW